MRQKKVVAVCSSPRGGKGGDRSLTEKFLNAFLEGLAPEDFKIFYPHDMKMAFCTGCYTCWLRTPGICAINDDMTEANAALREADLIILATPVYVDGMSAQLKTFLDRSICSFDALIIADQEGHLRHKLLNEKKRQALLISTCGFPEMDNFDPLRAHFAAICRNCFWDNAGEILIPASALGSMPGGYEAELTAVKEAGKEFAAEEKISDQTRQKVTPQSMDALKYMDIVNTFFAKLMKRNK